jgi:hypothetical protein
MRCPGVFANLGNINLSLKPLTGGQRLIVILHVDGIQKIVLVI